jgi:hypothetical protein
MHKHTNTETVIHTFIFSLSHGRPRINRFFPLYLLNRSANCFFFGLPTCHMGKHFLWDIFRRRLERKMERKKRRRKIV